MTATPAAPWLCLQVRDARCVRMSLAGPGATELRLSSSGWVADWPISPSTETSASSIGKIDSTP